MQYTKLGNSDLTVSRICMGCMGFGDASNVQHSWTVDEVHSREIIKRALELGVNFFNDADFLGSDVVLAGLLGRGPHTLAEYPEQER